MARGPDERLRGLAKPAASGRTCLEPDTAEEQSGYDSLVHRNRVLEHQNRQLQLIVARLSHLAYLDGLTGLANRRYLDMTLDMELRRASRTGAPVTLAICDIDHFKRFNDKFGHQCGDAVLKSVAETICRQCRRAGDVAARYGGEEFALLLPGVASAETVVIAEMLRRGIARLSIRRGSVELERVTISIGLTTYRSGEPCTPADVLRAADTALYRAKHAGRNRTKYEPIRARSGQRKVLVR
jgi:diguanylate cyclase (GGDEF)-like protein